MKTISLLHPFSAKAIGLSENDIIKSHSKPQVLALQEIAKHQFTFYVDYFTGSFFMQKRENEGVVKRFFPITYPFFKRHQWRNQFSFVHYCYYWLFTPDLTIINMSGHGSKYIFKLAKLILRRKKKYIAMIGGLHMSYTGKALEYYQNANHIIVHTLQQKQEILKNANFSKLDIRVLPLGIDTNLFQPSKDKRFDKFKLLYVGRLSRLKQIEIAIDSINFLKQNGIACTFTIIGPISDGDYYKELLQKVEANDCLDSVRFLGSKSNTELISYYQESHLLLFPSAHESFGMVMTEAMACGVPVVALKGAGGPDEIITNGVDGILTEKENFSKEVYEVLNSQEKLLQLSQSARIKVVNKFSLEMTTKLMQDSIASALE